MSRAVYFNGNPLGRMLFIIADKRQEEQITADTAAVAEGFRWWCTVLVDPTRCGNTPDDNDYITSSFSAAPIAELLCVRVPIFVGYGTHDKAVFSDDYLRLESMRLCKILLFGNTRAANIFFFELNRTVRPITVMTIGRHWAAVFRAGPIY